MLTFNVKCENKFNSQYRSNRRNGMLQGKEKSQPAVPIIHSTGPAEEMECCKGKKSLNQLFR